MRTRLPTVLRINIIVYCAVFMAAVVWRFFLSGFAVDTAGDQSTSAFTIAGIVLLICVGGIILTAKNYRVAYDDRSVRVASYTINLRRTVSSLALSGVSRWSTVDNAGRLEQIILHGTGDDGQDRLVLYRRYHDAGELQALLELIAQRSGLRMPTSLQHFISDEEG